MVDGRRGHDWWRDFFDTRVVVGIAGSLAWFSFAVGGLIALAAIGWIFRTGYRLKN